ncbi:hypothetical protein QO004_001452 [Rhizobium mesoamericanum]|uniref:hypothetical protein n=1 Tax=Rhizobium mesoamericanum TaxID=1079800 RepID=UPI00278216A1|nr:hypothetical protein [Rhizobium mesoamericanum]MDQ0559674.1 hypothetical protein [Rhizobium mesoamericanum]
MITLIAIADIADMVNDSRDKYSPRAENEFYESFASSRMVRIAAFVTSFALSVKRFSPEHPVLDPSEPENQAACRARP